MNRHVPKSSHQVRAPVNYWLLSLLRPQRLNPVAVQSATLGYTQLKQRITRSLALALCFALIAGFAVRYYLSPFALKFVALDSLCAIGFCTAAVLAGKNQLKVAGVITLVSMSVVIIGTGFAAGGLHAPVFIAAPLIPLTANLLFGIRAGALACAGTVLALLGVLALGMMGASADVPPIPTEQLDFFRGLMLAFTCVLATVVVFFYERQQRGLRQLATHDSLTGVANRRYFNTALTQECELAQKIAKPLSLIIFDLDHFKRYNDEYGHQAGDECLVRVVHALNGKRHNRGELLARYGGEEFMLILPATSSEEAKAIGNSLRLAIESLDLVHAQNRPPLVTVSLGIATIYPKGESCAGQLINMADAALYEAKESGRNRVVAFSG